MAVKSINNFAQFIEYVGHSAISRADVSAQKAVLKAYLQDHTLTKAMKIEADTKIVGVIARHYGVKATQAEKNGRLSMMTFARAGHSDERTAALYARASSALAYARNTFIDPKITLAASSVEKARDAILKAMNSSDADTKAEARIAIKSLMLALKASWCAREARFVFFCVHMP